MSFSHGAIVLGAGEGKTISVLGIPYTYKAVKEETRGAYALIEHTVAGDGPPPHFHTAEEEAFYVLEGELNVLVGDRTVTATTGAFVLVPRGTVHTFSKTGTASAKILVIVSPAGFEEFLRRSRALLIWRRLRPSPRSITWKSWSQRRRRAEVIIKKPRCHQIKRDFWPPDWEICRSDQSSNQRVEKSLRASQPLR